MFAAQPGDTPEGTVAGSSPRGDTRARLVAAASALLAEGGSAAVTLRAVGDRAGVSRTAPYRHFRDKDDLLTAVLADAMNRLYGAFAAEITAARPVPEALRRAFLSYVRFGLDWPEHYLLMFGERLADLHSIAPQAFSSLPDVLTEWQRAGEIRAGDIGDMSFLVLSALHGLVTIALAGHLAAKGLDTDEALERLVAELVAGLTA